ncbi:hypothetical protein [Ornithobacterium rhinotracheale]|uniref:hypothetical protein n=1 Tax=Ornithobacterium rhinotracheale TaxID=28251 RepID=UPI001FF55274|nr:hypothetical protein [Ornithobacterium rhinotracheale]MCK0201325.1 hypothetical protein [Ornithobacterium rhinotracheale]
MIYLETELEIKGKKQKVIMEKIPLEEVEECPKGSVVNIWLFNGDSYYGFLLDVDEVFIVLAALSGDDISLGWKRDSIAAFYKQIKTVNDDKIEDI